MEYISGKKPDGCLIRECANGNEEAYRVAATLYSYIDWLDNVHDRDVDSSPEDTTRTSLNLLMMLSFNPFWQEHKEKLTPLLIASYNTWLDSERCKKHGDYRVRVCADALKGYFLEVFYMIAFLTGGANGYENMRALAMKWRGFDFDAVPDAPQATPQSLEVAPGREFVFPRDHLAHPEYAVEWWYLSGIVREKSGKKAGIHIVMFRIGGAYHTHFSLFDMDTNKSVFYETVTDKPTVVYEAPNRLDIQFKANDLDIEFVGKISSDVVLQGDGGYSVKSSRPNHASYYYSIPKIRLSGYIKNYEWLNPIDGDVWFDHEWGNSLKPEGCRWAWFWCEVGGTYYMAYLMIENGVVDWRYSRFISIGKLDVPADKLLTPCPLMPEGAIGAGFTIGDLSVIYYGEPFKTQLGTYLEVPCTVIRQSDKATGMGYIEITT